MPSEPIDTNEVDTEFFDEALAIENKVQYVKDVIIPQMDILENRSTPMTQEEIERKLYDAPDDQETPTPKELKEELDKLPEEPLFTPGLLQKIAEITYYYSQPNYKPKEMDSHLLFIVKDLSNAALLCIVAYTTRLRYGHMENYEEIEDKTMTSLFEYLKTKEKYKWLND